MRALSVLSSMVQPDRQSQCATHTHPLSNPATVTFNLFHPNLYTLTWHASRSRLSCAAHLVTLASTVFQLLIMCSHTYRQTERASIPLCTTWSCVIIFHWSTHLHNLSVHWCTAVVVDRSLTGHWTCQYAQPATWDVTGSWWQDTAEWKPAGFVTCAAALAAFYTALVHPLCPWPSAEPPYRQHRWQLPGTGSRWCWQGWRQWPPSGVVSGSWSSTLHSTLWQLSIHLLEGHSV